MQKIKVDAQTDEQQKKDFVNQVIDSEKGWREKICNITYFQGFPKNTDCGTCFVNQNKVKRCF